MSASAWEWIIILIFFLFVFGLTLVEAIWLSKMNWANFGKSLAFAVVTNAIGFFAGFAVLFVIGLLIFMFVFDGAIDKYRHGELALWAALIFGILFFPLFLALCKVIFLKILKIQAGKAAWIFSLVGSSLIVFLALGVPVLAGYFIFSR
ncbi:MAG TPA: hypothetical protein VGC76_16530 [Pyrinomonadaceae bacterium]|jgi:hypothetical protein